MRTVKKLSKIPEILYEAPTFPGEKTSPVPYMEIEKDEEMPIGLFLLEYHKTGEYELGTSNKPEEIMDGPHPHMYINFGFLQEILPELFPNLDTAEAIKQIRTALGLKPTSAESKAEGEAIHDRVAAKAEALKVKLQAEQEERIAKVKKLLAEEKAKEQVKKEGN